MYVQRCLRCALFGMQLNRSIDKVLWMVGGLPD